MHDALRCNIVAIYIYLYSKSLKPTLHITLMLYIALYIKSLNPYQHISRRSQGGYAFGL